MIILIDSLKFKFPENILFKHNYWCHSSCVGISSHSYQHLLAKSRSFAWNCFRCGSTNVTLNTSLQGSDHSDANIFSPLYDLDQDSVEATNTRSNFPLTSIPVGSPDGVTTHPEPCFSTQRPPPVHVLLKQTEGFQSDGL